MTKAKQVRKMVRLKDIADACGVSVATVSRALNGIPTISREQTKLITRTAKEMGYYPNSAARTLKTSRSYNIGILYEDRLDHEYFSSLLNSLRREAELRGYDLTLISQENAEASDDNYYEHARRRNLDGVIVIQADFDSAGVMRLATSSIPSVIIDHMYNGCDCVGSDNRASVEQLVKYAFSLGHRRIAFIAGQLGAVGRERLAGYYKVCAELGIRVPESHVHEGGFHSPAECVRILRELLADDDRPTCVLCPDDFSCLGAIGELTDDGIRIPGDISLIGYDGITVGQMARPRLTTYRQNIDGIAREAVSLLLEAVEHPDEHQPRQIIVEGKLIPGETTAELYR